MAEATEKSAELEEARKQLAELKSEYGRLADLVSSADAKKQKATAVIKDKYLRELAKLEGKKNAEIEEMKKKLKGAETHSFKEGEALYIKQYEAAKDLFFKCGWRATVTQLGHQLETKVYNPPRYFIPGSMAEYAATVQQQFLKELDEEEETMPNDTSVVNDPADQSARLESVVEDLTDELPTETVLATGIVLPAETGLRVDLDAELDAEIDDLFNWLCIFFFFFETNYNRAEAPPFVLAFEFWMNASFLFKLLFWLIFMLIPLLSN